MFRNITNECSFVSIVNLNQGVSTLGSPISEAVICSCPDAVTITSRKPQSGIARSYSLLRGNAARYWLNSRDSTQPPLCWLRPHTIPEFSKQSKRKS